MESGKFYLGGVIDPRTSERTGEPISYDSDELTTHGVIVGMTGSGKTGLGIGLIEEALASDIPCLVLDPKGDMGNLLLNFPDFRPEEFLPWVDEAEARREGVTTEELAASTASAWKQGLDSWGITPERMRSLRAHERVRIYTPGSSSGIGLDILGSLQAPATPFDDDPETHRDEIEGYTASLLTLAGVESDPVSGREHILIATIIETAWRSGIGLSLADVIGQIITPPFRKLGVFELDTFFAGEDRTALAMKLNGLVASPSFASWMQGVPLDIGSMLMGDGDARVAVVYLAHLSEAERQFVVTLILAKLVTWTRSQSGTSELRGLVYMDEVFGFCPPTAEPPSKKPILTLLKQARAFGVGMVLSTQNPVDLDYKAMSNAGTWMIGRLQTERDKARILEGLRSVSGTVDAVDFDTLISGLDKRQFVLHTTKSDAPRVFGTRWAMSYLAGPLTRDEIKRLTPQSSPVGKAGPVEARSEPATPAPAPASVPLGDETTPVAPTVADGVEVTYADPAAGWIADMGIEESALSPAAVATVRLLYDDQHAAVDHREDFEAIIHPLTATVDDSNLHIVDHDPRDFSEQPPTGAVYALVDQPIDTKTYWNELERALRDHLVANKRVTVWKNPELKSFSRVGESKEDFLARCAAAAEDAADDEIAGLKDKYSTKIDRVRDQISQAERRVRDLEGDVAAQRQEEVVSGAGDLLGAILGGRRRSSSISRAASRRSQTRKTEARLDTAIGAMEDKAADLIELEDELETDILQIADRWNAAASSIEEVDIALEKTDVDVQPLGLTWIARPGRP